MFWFSVVLKIIIIIIIIYIYIYIYIYIFWRISEEKRKRKKQVKPRFLFRITAPIWPSSSGYAWYKASTVHELQQYIGVSHLPVKPSSTGIRILFFGSKISSSLFYKSLRTEVSLRLRLEEKLITAKKVYKYISKDVKGDLGPSLFRARPSLPMHGTMQTHRLQRLQNHPRHLLQPLLLHPLLSPPTPSPTHPRNRLTSASASSAGLRPHDPAP
jgi:hypothetical protein